MLRKDEDAGWLIGTFAIAAVLRLAHVLSVRGTPIFELLYIDPSMYDTWARGILAGHWVSEAPFFLDPFYPYFVAAIYAVSGSSLTAVALAQALLGALVPPMLLLAARPWLGRPSARVAAVLAALYLPAIYYATPLLKPGLAHVLVAGWLWLGSRAMRHGGLADGLGCGALFALTWLLRGNLLWVALPLAAAMALFRARDLESRALGARPALAFVGGFALVAAFPLAHNVAVSGEWILGTTNVGQIYFIGNQEGNESGRFQELPFVRSDPSYEQVDFKTEAERRNGREMSHGEVSRYWLGQGLDWTLAHPGDWLAVTWSKVRLFWGAYETPASHDYYLYRRRAPVLRLPLPMFGTLGPLGLLGLALAWRRPGWPRWLATYVVLACLAVSLFFVLTRFRMIVVPPLCVFAGFACVEVVRFVREKRWALVAAAAAGLLVAGAFVNLPVRATSDTWWFRAARAVGLPTQEAVTANAHFNLGVTWADAPRDAADLEQRLEHAERELRAAIAEQEDPKYVIELGKVLARLQRNEEAIGVYRRAVELQPGDFRAHHAIGLLSGRIGDMAGAEQAFRAALSVERRYVRSWVALGELLVATGRPAEAEQAFVTALRLRPDDAAARRGLSALRGR